MIGPKRKGHLLIVAIALVALIIIYLIIHRKCPNSFRGKIKAKLLEGTVVHIVTLGTATGIDGAVVIIRAWPIGIQDCVVPARNHG